MNEWSDFGESNGIQFTNYYAVHRLFSICNQSEIVFHLSLVQRV